ncbi:MAG: heavy-metal-associated domain-containing protein, partial [Chloroflexota bacterium]
MTIESARVARTGEMPAQGGLVELVMPVRGMTCQSCVRHVRTALESVPGVVSARVELAAGLAKVSFDPARATVAMLQDAVEAAGYVPGEPVGITDSPAAEDGGRDRSTVVAKPGLRRPVIFGFLASSLLVAFYAGIVTAAQGFEHAADLLLEDWYFVLPIVVGFGVQVGLFVHLRRSSHHQST